jgi:hypothetical protein
VDGRRGDAARRVCLARHADRPRADPLDGLPHRAWAVRVDGELVGALVVLGVTALTRSEEQVMHDLGAQAGPLLDRLTLADVVHRQWTAGTSGTSSTSPQWEREILELMAAG